MFTASVIAILWRMMLDPNGVINYFIQVLGISDESVTFLASRDIALYSVTLINIWSGYPFYMISILAGLQGISPICMKHPRWMARIRYSPFSVLQFRSSSRF